MSQTARTVAIKVDGELVAEAVAAATGLGLDEAQAWVRALDDASLAVALDAAAEVLRDEVRAFVCAPRVLEEMGSRLAGEAALGLPGARREQAAPDPDDLAEMLKTKAATPARARRRGISLGEQA